MDDIHQALYGGSRGYRPPILTTVYNIVGTVTLVIAIMAAVLLVAGGALAGSAAGVVVSVPVIVGGLLAALLCFGSAQVINYIGQTAYNTSTERNDEIVNVRKKIESHLSTTHEGHGPKQKG